jgi:oligopeptide/dipeptide ABC transporter ATP-binding protein
MDQPLLKVENVSKFFPIYGGILRRKVAQVHAVNNVSLEVQEGETLGLVGESGCGKSTLGKTLIRLYDPTSGRAFLNGKDIFSLKSRKELNAMRREVQMIFQDPFSSLNPRMTVGDIVQEPLLIHEIGDPQSRLKRARELMEIVGLRKNTLDRYPHEFSGGQRQRIGIARSLALKPKLIIADEPVSALDVSIQSQVLNLITELQRDFGITYVFISHDLGVVEYISDTIAVMYLGRIVEIASKEEIFKNPQHPYTQALVSAIPVPDPERKHKRIILEGDVPSPIYPPTGCHFHPRCPVKTKPCEVELPELKEIPSQDGKPHLVACPFTKI